VERFFHSDVCLNDIVFVILVNVLRRFTMAYRDLVLLAGGILAFDPTTAAEKYYLVENKN